MIFYPINKNGAIPIYVQIAELIKRNIEEGHLKEEELLPSESHIMEAYQVSRITVRNALLRLEYDRLLHKVHGKGTFVSKREWSVVTSPFSSFEKQLARQGIEVNHEIIEIADVIPPDQIRIDLNLSPRQMATKVKRLIKIREATIGMRTSYVPLDIGRSLKGWDLNRYSVVEFLNQSAETRLTKMEVRVQAATILEGNADVMGVDYDSTVLMSNFVYRNHAGRPVLAGRVIYLAQHGCLKMSITAQGIFSGASIDELPID